YTDRAVKRLDSRPRCRRHNRRLVRVDWMRARRIVAYMPADHGMALARLRYGNGGYGELNNCDLPPHSGVLLQNRLAQILHQIQRLFVGVPQRVPSVVRLQWPT